MILKKNNLVLKEKYFDKFLFIMFLYILIYFLMSKFFNEYPCKNGTKYFCIFLVSEHHFEKIKLAFLAAGVSTPPPFANAFAKYTSYFLRAP